MNISQENRVIAAVERFEALERKIAANKPVLKLKPAPKKPKDLTPIEIKRKKQKEAVKTTEAEEKRLAEEEEDKKAQDLDEATDDEAGIDKDLKTDPK